MHWRVVASFTKVRALALYALCALTSFACHHEVSQSRTNNAPPRTMVSASMNPPSERAPSTATSKFHVVAELVGFDPEQGPGVRPCWLSSELFLCPGSDRFEGREFGSIPFRLPYGPHVVGGRWPDAVWQVDLFHAGFKHALLKLDPKEFVWRSVGEVHRWNATSKFEVAAWLPGQAIVVEHGLGPDERRPPTEDGRFSEAIRITSPGSALPDLPVLTRNGKPLLRTVEALAAFETGEIALVGQAAGSATARVLFWPEGRGGATVHDLGSDECYVEHHFAPLPTDQVVVGQGRNGGCAFRFDGQTWSSMEMPPATAIRGYAREPKGTEWVVVHSLEKNKSRSLQFWSRERNATWKRVDLPVVIPAVQNAWTSKGCGAHLPGGKVWARGDGDVWLLAQACGPCGFGLNLLFHTQRPTSVCRRFSISEDGCTTISREEVRVDRCDLPIH